ncbi:hypothetical protein [Dactylosporangium sp. CA-092794]|uniref:hypothetical protein n=1 Tax=Dactylosporangium sp. CA-092794 TaxID=3239929 RepID=UPI003D8BAA74
MANRNSPATSAAGAKYSEALAHEIADALGVAAHPFRVAVRYDRAAETHTVRVTTSGFGRYDLPVPQPGARYALFRNGARIGGVNLTAAAAPATVADALLDHIAATLLG